MALAACATYPPASGEAAITATKLDGSTVAVRGPVRSAGVIGCDVPTSVEFYLGPRDEGIFVLANESGLQVYIYPPTLASEGIQSFGDPGSRPRFASTPGPGMRRYNVVVQGTDGRGYPEPPGPGDVVELDIRLTLNAKPVAVRGGYLGGTIKCPRP